MRTLVISDLHLGAASGADVLRRPGQRAALIEALEDVDRLVLLGDVLELRHGPRRDALGAARPFFEELGRVLAGREIVVVAGNHDNALVESWTRRRDETERKGPLGLEQCIPAEEASSMLATLASWAQPARLSAAYPGLWLRPDVYAMHGHYLDCHLTIPTVERLGVAITARVLRRSADSFATVADYEAVTGPVFAWIDAAARQNGPDAPHDTYSTARMWRSLEGLDGATHGVNGQVGEIASLSAVVPALRRWTMLRALPLGIAALNRAGVGPFSADLSAAELRRSALRAMGQVTANLHLGDAYVIFGHTHRAGPLSMDALAEWRGPTGARLINSGCWIDDTFLAGGVGEVFYAPGVSVVVEEDGSPRLLRLLGDRRGTVSSSADR